MKVLAIDYITYLGHRNFNKIHIEALSNIGCSIQLVGRESAFEMINTCPNISKFIFPKWTSKRFPFYSVSERIKNIVSLFWIKRKIVLADYDLIIFLAYDIMSISFFRTKYNVVLVNHNNVSQLNNTFKRFLTHKLPTHYKQVVLTKDSADYLKDLMINNVFYVPHGFVTAPKRTKRPLCLRDDQRFIFIPVNRWYNEKIIADIVSSENVMNLLSEKNMVIVMKKKLYNGGGSRNVVLLDNNIPDDEYNYLTCKALSVVLPYSKDFQYRSSGILFECVAYNIPIISTCISAMLHYKDSLNISYFDSVEEFIDCIQKVSNGSIAKMDTNSMNPDQYWKEIIKKN